MPLEIVRNDLVKMKVDAIVNLTNPHMYASEGVDGLVHKIAGQALRKETIKLGSCKVKEVKLTKAYHMPCDYIIHTVGPICKDGSIDEEALIINCYKNALELALNHNFKSIAFPLITSGSFAYPKDKVLNIAIKTIGEFLLKHDMMVYLVVYDQQSFKLSEKLFKSIKAYIDDYYVEENNLIKDIDEKYLEDAWHNISESASCFKLEKLDIRKESSPPIFNRKLEDVIKNIDETFSEMLIRLIDQRDILEAEAYKKANVDRKLFSKIKNNKDYKPSKSTVLAFTIALELSIDECKDLMNRAGFTLSSSSRFDLIIRFFIEEEDYDIFKINEALYAFEEKTLGV